MDRIENCISFLIGKAGQRISKRARDKLSVHGVTPTQYAVLNVLWERDGQSGAELGERLVVDSATITGVVDRLVAAGQGQSLQAPLDAAMDQLNDEVARERGDQTPALLAALRRLGDPRG